jgi:ankyrin repeat protein
MEVLVPNRLASLIGDPFSDEETVELLAKFHKAGYQLDYQDSLGMTALMYATVYQRPKSVEYLLSQRVQVDTTNWFDGTALYYASQHEDTTILQMLLQAGANPKQRTFKGKCKDCLTEATLLRNFQAVELLLKTGADPTYQTPDGDSALTMAERQSETKIFNLIQDALNRV